MKVSTRIRLGLGFGVQVLLTAVLGIGVLFGMDKGRASSRSLPNMTPR